MELLATGKNFKTLAKMGYGARGMVYLTIGGLALLTAFGEGGKTTDSKGAIVEIMQQPFGKVLLTILIIGLLGYVIWRFTQAIKDADGHGPRVWPFAVVYSSAHLHTSPWLFGQYCY
jgi:hypothetical protein